MADDLLRIDFPTLLIVPDWIEAHCVIRDDVGELVPFVMYDWQLHCTLHQYRVRGDAKVGQFGPAFQYRRGQVIAPQKTGKGPWAAAGVCAEGVGPVLFAGWARGGEVYRCRDHGCGCGWEYVYEPGEPMGRPWPSAMIQLLATAEDQVANVFRPLQSMIRNGPLADMMRVGEEFIRLPSEGRIEVVTSSAQARLGNPITYCVQDETQLYTAQNGMIAVAETMRRGVAGMKGRSLETTNAYDQAVVSTASKTRTSKSADVFRFYDEPPADLDYMVAEDRHAIHVYNYRGCRHIDVAAIDAEAAELCETDPAQAERFYGNRIRAGFDAAFDLTQWDNLRREDYSPAAGAVVTVGVDGARFDDALAVIATEVATGFQWPVAIMERPQNADDDYEHDLEHVDAMMVDLFERFAPFVVYIDPQWIEPLVERWLGRWGPKRIKAYPTNRPRAIADVLADFRAAQTTAELGHNGDEVYRSHIANSRRRSLNVLDDEGRPRWGIWKDAPKSPRKIDGAMAGALSWKARRDAVAQGVKDRPRREAVFI